jgi:hypothetical protein
MPIETFSHSIDTLVLLEGLDRPGICSLVKFLRFSNFFTSPASTKFHGCEEGGLCNHSFRVYELFRERNRNMKNPVPEDSEIICGLLHDVCKIGYYEKQGDVWVRKKDHPANRSHGVLSVKIIKQYIDLTPEEEAIIKYHMGLFSVFGLVREYKTKNLYEAIARYPSVQIFAACDNEEAHWKDR